ncbi:Phosphoserine phosphatase RsbP [Gemmata obscuriglobus]|uniref:Response regulator n=1 Tax=Gemmata obscuriglobus TaxID=114 RepID=A0A2Z3GT80_9BACT|nr:SpoIIE family protein phosphatase [Gemmata obscuriglobus]AWM36478.1 response regulator [Gemmata obscuriglobus]QEG30896.1 Phosphoserine phosphatase RsbP [Gemmata obscuriglobus]VTS10229.1 response regulator : Serine phosphatase RsbU, regulator of sigma subunit OS=Singulisphaera acidiphila (strain ATCC BAA-1392 / DSM 18658 / VKM B-2454 / MOB10) GN=Sinac_4829 PE=4 SV=1: Response_reg: SpoIIE [Gemmata obscuriglobus UQM 2246]
MAEPHPIKVLLVDDQPMVGETVRRMLADEPLVEFRYCPDPANAIDTANAFKPTVILQDLVMPDIDGLQLVKYFRANSGTREVPLVVLSSKEEPVVKAKAFALGANDYMVKLPDRLEVLARVRYHSRGYVALLERNEAYRELAATQREMAAELSRAARYVQSLLPPPLSSGPVQIAWKFVPSTQLAGDMFGYRWIDKEHLALYLLDVSGHGVGSALLAVSAGNVLSANSIPGADPRDPGAVVTKLNDMFQMDRQDGKYFTIWYGVYHAANRTLAYCNAGHPPALLLSGGTLHSLEAEAPAVGMMPEMPYDTKSVPVSPDARLLVFSDGIMEIEQTGGEMWPWADFLALISSELAREGDLIGRHLEYVRELGGREVLADDFSMMDVRF